MPETKLCFIPHAGGSAMGYTNFKAYLDPSVRPYAFELAGRGKRINEPCFTDAVKCAENLFEINYKVFEEGNYALFGHSLGTVIAFELAKIIKSNNLTAPLHIFFSGKSAPHVPMCSEFDGISELDDKAFCERFVSLGAMSSNINMPQKIMDMIMPVMRADVEMAEKYYTEITNPVLDCDISIFYGKSDLIYSGENINSWAQCTSGKCDSYGFEGGHFYYSKPEVKKEVCKIIGEILNKKNF